MWNPPCLCVYTTNPTHNTMEEFFYWVILPTIAIILILLAGFCLGRRGEYDKGHEDGYQEGLQDRTHQVTQTFLLNLPHNTHVHIQYEGRKDDGCTNVYSIKIYDGAEQRFIKMELTECTTVKGDHPFQSGNFLVVKIASSPNYRLDPWDRKKNDS